ncbi:putative RNA-directed DNA polymerase, eukaryota, reverse transcriptase zinc-binding domain protein [Tanacetum coccineum]
MGFHSGDGKDLRPADLLLFNWLQGKDACLDVTGISPFAGMGANSWAPTVALLNAVEKKKKKYASICEDNGYKFIPFAFSTFGEFDKDALDTLLRIKSISISHSNNVKSGKFIFHRLSQYLRAIPIDMSFLPVLDTTIQLEEIKNAVWECGSQKAPGPDGFTFMFIKRYWDLLHLDIQTFVVNFFSSGSFPPGMNSSFFTLILKVNNPLFIKDFRPISLIGFQYKIVAKILANRLSKVIDSVISKEQSAFISGRQILDGPLILSEVIDWYKKRKKKLLLFKVDFEKAFDSVSWRFLDHVMDKLGFSSTWRRWIRAGLMTSRTSILINGSPTSEFSIKRGLRQGDPLSPFLFIIVMEGLHITLRDGLMENMFRGVSIGSPRLKININKSNLYGVGVPSSEVVRLAAGTGCSAISLPLTYLGLPIGSNMGRILNWKVLIDRFKARLSGWKANMLSSEGRLTLINLCSVKVLKSIHGDEAGFDIKGCQSNGLWAGIVGSIYHLHSSGYLPLNSFRIMLFRLEKNQDCLISDRINNGSWSWDWSRPLLPGRTQDDLNNLLIDISSLDIEVDRDSPTFILSADNTFSVSVDRKYLDDCMLHSSLPCTRWYKVLLMKVNIFMWRLFLDRLPHRLNISSRGLDIDSISCPVCNSVVESNSHVFFSCNSASNIWRLVRGWCDQKFLILSTCSDWDSWLSACNASKDKKDRAYVIFASTCWVIWRYRNDIVFNSQVMRKCDIFDTIRLFSFSWYKFRGNKCISWTDWLKSPL